MSAGTLKSAEQFTANEVAILAEASPRAVRKALEEGVLGRTRATSASPRRGLGSDAVAYMALMTSIDWPIPVEGKRRIARWVRAAAGKHAKLENPFVMHGPILLDAGLVAPLLGSAFKRAEHYWRARTRWIVRDRNVMGGTPTIKGTRVTVYSVLGRVEHGEAIRAIARENKLPGEAVEAALTFARANPMRGRPAGRPWKRAA